MKNNEVSPLVIMSIIMFLFMIVNCYWIYESKPETSKAFVLYASVVSITIACFIAMLTFG